jgi:hypothetical protein
MNEDREIRPLSIAVENGNDETFRGIRNLLYYCFADVSHNSLRGRTNGKHF